MHTLYIHTPMSPGGQMHSYCLNFIPHFSSICSLLPLLAGPIEIGLLLRTPSIPENETNRMHYIPLGRDVEQGDLPSFYKWYQIRERKVCQLWNYWSSGSFLFLLTEREPQRLLERSNRGGEDGLSMCSLSPIFFFPVINCWGQSCQGWLCVHLLWLGRQRDCHRATWKQWTLPPDWQWGLLRVTPL